VSKQTITTSRNTILVLQFLLLFPFLALEQVFSQEVRVPSISFEPRTYIVYKTEEPIRIDGNLNKEVWENAPWTETFLDIQGDHLPEPRHKTRAKMLWDEDYFYFAAKLEEPHIWATKTERDAVIFMDNNFEIFIDPNGDTHHYYEFEVNAKGTFWDLMLTKPYRNGGRPIDAWDIKGIKIGIDIQGTLNDPSDVDTSWTVEVAIPWDVLAEATRSGRPGDGDQWRVNFSRVQWQTEIIDGEYVKKTDPETGRDLPEDNWSWSPQGLINMHFPEMWGFVQFSDQPVGNKEVEFEWNPDEDYKWLLRKLYYRQISHRNEHGKFADHGDALNYDELFTSLFDDSTPRPELTIMVLDDNYIMRLSGDDLNQNYYIRQDSRVWAR
jgi:hypothetical protein